MEIKKLIEFYNMQGAERQIGRILLCGGSSNIKNLVPYLTKELNLPVERLNPFSQISGSEGIPEDYKANLGVALGLAMRYPGDLPK